MGQVFLICIAVQIEEKPYLSAFFRPYLVQTILSITVQINSQNTSSRVEFYFRVLQNLIIRGLGILFVFALLICKSYEDIPNFTAVIGAFFGFGKCRQFDSKILDFMIKIDQTLDQSIIFRAVCQPLFTIDIWISIARFQKMTRKLNFWVEILEPFYLCNNVNLMWTKMWSVLKCIRFSVSFAVHLKN